MSSAGRATLLRTIIQYSHSTKQKIRKWQMFIDKHLDLVQNVPIILFPGFQISSQCNRDHRTKI